ncbi:ABC transporter ATP-binding protein [Bacillus sp. FSL W7-1360]
MAAILEVENLQKRYADKAFALKGVSFSIPRGVVVGFIGENGAGKSTTMGAILGTLHKDAGTVRVFGEEMTEKNYEVKERIGVVFDEMNLPGTLTVVKLGDVLRHIYQNWDQGTFDRYIDFFSLPRKKKIGGFSRGMSMKLSAAVALSHDAKLLILDEATAGLDTAGRHDLLQVLQEFVKDGERSILLSSHITSDIEKIADELIFIKGGEILLKVSKEVLLTQYAVLSCTQSEFEQIASHLVVAYKQAGDQLEVLVSDWGRIPATVEQKDFSIDDVTVLLMRGERA